VKHLTTVDKFLLFCHNESSDFSSDIYLSATSYAPFSGTLRTVTNGSLRRLYKDDGMEHIYTFPAQHKTGNAASQQFKQSTLFGMVMC